MIRGRYPNRQTGTQIWKRKQKIEWQRQRRNKNKEQKKMRLDVVQNTFVSCDFTELATYFFSLP